MMGTDTHCLSLYSCWDYRVQKGGPVSKRAEGMFCGTASKLNGQSAFPFNDANNLSALMSTFLISSTRTVKLTCNQSGRVSVCSMGVREEVDC